MGLIQMHARLSRCIQPDTARHSQAEPSAPARAASALASAADPALRRRRAPDGPPQPRRPAKRHLTRLPWLPATQLHRPPSTIRRPSSIHRLPSAVHPCAPPLPALSLRPLRARARPPSARLPSLLSVPLMRFPSPPSLTRPRPPRPAFSGPDHDWHVHRLPDTAMDDAAPPNYAPAPQLVHAERARSRWRQARVQETPPHPVGALPAATRRDAALRDGSSVRLVQQIRQHRSRARRHAFGLHRRRRRPRRRRGDGPHHGRPPQAPPAEAPQHAPRPAHHRRRPPYAPRRQVGLAEFRPLGAHQRAAHWTMVRLPRLP